MKVYNDFKNKLSLLVSEAQQIIDVECPKSFEGKQSYRIVEDLQDELETALYELDYISKPAIEGKLHEMDNGKFELIDDNSKYGAYFSCGSRIEIYDPETGKWHIGRVEHKMENDRQGYYFRCGDMDNPYLYTGMTARIRRN